MAIIEAIENPKVISEYKFTKYDVTDSVKNAVKEVIDQMSLLSIYENYW